MAAATQRTRMHCPHPPQRRLKLRFTHGCTIARRAGLSDGARLSCPARPAAHPMTTVRRPPAAARLPTCAARSCSSSRHLLAHPQASASRPRPQTPMTSCPCAEQPSPRQHLCPSTRPDDRPLASSTRQARRTLAATTTPMFAPHPRAHPPLSHQTTRFAHQSRPSMPSTHLRASALSQLPQMRTAHLSGASFVSGPAPLRPRPTDPPTTTNRPHTRHTAPARVLF
jgi:hypothetical protein